MLLQVSLSQSDVRKQISTHVCYHCYLIIIIIIIIIVNCYDTFLPSTAHWLVVSTGTSDLHGCGHAGGTWLCGEQGRPPSRSCACLLMDEKT